jgi:hypothetical protein
LKYHLQGENILSQDSNLYNLVLSETLKQTPIF